MQQMTDFFGMVQAFTGNNVLYIFSGVGLLLFLREIKEKRHRIIAALTILILIAALFNPLSYKIFAEKLGFWPTYYRFLWIVPANLLLGFAIYQMISHFKRLSVQFLAVILVCASVLGTHVAKDNLKLPENAYQIPTRVVEVADTMEQVMDDAGEETAMILADTEVIHVIRQYDANIRVPVSGLAVSTLDPNRNTADVYGLMAMLMNNRNDIPAETVSQIIAGTGIEYLVVNQANTVSLEYMQQLGWKIIASTSDCHILAPGGWQPVFTTEPLTEQGITAEEVNVTIPGLPREYHFLFLSDLHIISESDEIAESERQTVRDRKTGFSVSDQSSEEYWRGLPAVLDACHADAVLFGGDMIDFCSAANVQCLRTGLDALQTPRLYVRADHDYAPWWCEGITEDQCRAMHAEIDGDQEVWNLEMPEFCIAGLSNSTSQISAEGLQKMREIFALGKPVILLTHVPYDSELTADLESESKKNWQDRALLWGENCSYVPDENTRALVDMIRAENSPVKEILCGHLHFMWDGNLTQTTRQHVFSPAYGHTVGVVNVRGE